MRKLILVLSLIILTFTFANSANAIENANNTQTNSTQQTQQQTLTPKEQKAVQKRYMQRVKAEKSVDNAIKFSKSEVKLQKQVSSESSETTEAKVKIPDNATLTLNDCIDIALLNSPAIRKYKDLVAVANAQLGQQKANYFPSLNLGTGYTGTGTKADSYDGWNNVYNASASISQLVYSFNKVGTLIKKARLNKIKADYDLKNQIIQTIFTVKTDYFAVLAALANIKVQEANISVNERQYQQTKAYFEEGLKSKIDLVNAEVNLSAAKIQLVTAQNEYDLAVVALNNAMYLDGKPKYSIEKRANFNFVDRYADVNLINTKQGTKPFKAEGLKEGEVFKTSVEKSQIVDKHYEYKLFPYTMEESIQFAKDNRPDLKAYIAMKDAARKEVTYQKIKYLPDLKANAGYTFNNTDSINMHGFNIKGSLDFNAINAMDIKYKIKEAEYKLYSAESELDKAQKDAIYSVQKAYVNMVSYEKKIPLTENAVVQTYENLQLALGRYEVGLGNFLEVQDAIVNYNSAQENYVKIIFNYNVSRAKLELEIAKMDEYDLSNNKWDKTANSNNNSQTNIKKEK